MATTTTKTMTTNTTIQQEKPWTSHPFKLISDTGLNARSDVPRDHYVVKFTKDMALVHNLVLRGLNAAYNQCLSVTPGTQAAQDFLIFNQCVFEMLKSHHDMEEEELFPRLEKALNRPGAMANNVAEHHDFHDGLMRFQDYVYNTEADDYDGPTLHAIIESFGSLVEKHLHNEIAPLYDLHVIESNTLKALWNDVEKDYQPNFDKYRYVTIPLISYLFYFDRIYQANYVSH
jgi:hemerythrin-like domain-containing protein